MRIKRAYKTELAPNSTQKVLLSKNAGAARFAYNWGLSRRIEEYDRTGKPPDAMELHRELNALKKKHYPWAVRGIQVRPPGGPEGPGPSIRPLL